jgi:hypothetical protein
MFGDGSRSGPERGTDDDGSVLCAASRGLVVFRETDDFRLRSIVRSVETPLSFERLEVDEPEPIWACDFSTLVPILVFGAATCAWRSIA